MLSHLFPQLIHKRVVILTQLNLLVACTPCRRAVRVRIPQFYLLEAESSLTIPMSFIYLTLKTSSYPAGVKDKREEEERSEAMERKSQNTKQNPVPEDCFQKCTAGLRGATCSLTCASPALISLKRLERIYCHPYCFASCINSLYLLLSASI